MREVDIDPSLIKYAEIANGLKRWFSIDIDDGKFMAAVNDEWEEILIENAMCEKQRLTTDPVHPVYSARTIGNHTELVQYQRYFFGKDMDKKDTSYYELGGNTLIPYDENDPGILAKEGYSDDSIFV